MIVVLPKRIGLRGIVVALTLSIVAPLGVLSVISVQRTWRRQLANVDRQNIATARAISVAIDTQIETTTAALDVFGALHALDLPDIPSFDSLARRLFLRQPDWSSLLLADLNGRVIAVAPQADVDEAASFSTDWAQTVGATQKPVVSRLFEVPGLSGHFVMIAVPIVRNGKVTLALGARVRSDSLGAVLRQQQVPPNGAVSLVDAGYRTVARTKQEETYVGTKANQAFIGLISRTPEGSWTTDTRDGTPVYAAFSRSALTGMTVGLALPREEVDGPIRRILVILAGAWIVILGLGTTIGLAFGGVIVRAMRGASQSAMALARGQAVAPAHSRIVEIDDLSTGLRLAAETLEARNRERDEASRLKDEFLMTVSHELRTPLTAIYGWARMLSTGQIRDSQRRRAIDAIERNAAALHQLVNDLLDVSRVVSGRLRLDVEPVALPDVVGAAIDAIRPAAHAKNIAVEATMGEGDLCVRGDAGRLQQVIWNLLTNAVRFTPAGGSIEIAAARSGASLEIVVRDTGPGLEAVFLPHAFERFRQGAAGTTRAHGGLGLGLAIVRHLVELHGGTVEAFNNTPAPGATFRIRLPAPSPSAPAARGGEAAALVAGSRPAIRVDGVRVLVADDDMNARELLAVILENAGAEVRAASSAEDALMILQAWTPEVVISDIEMPGEDGFGLIEKAHRMTAGRASLVAIALTAHARPEDRVRALGSGFQWHIAKPLEPSELLSVIVMLLAQKKGVGDPKLGDLKIAELRN
ncbi:MAG TPA: ATP-binding protein [Vicinamibacterales bacterium]|nr:ATP-binding protein [Vicinamibacterales bacterium]